MTKTQELLEECRTKLDGVTDYKMAKSLEIPRARMSEYVRGTGHADAYAATKIALLLERDPLEVIAQVEAESSSTEAKRAFWRSFPSGLRRTALGVGFLAICGSSAIEPRVGEAASPEASGSHNVY